MNKLIYIVIAMILLVGLFLVIRPKPQSPATTRTTEGQQTTAQPPHTEPAQAKTFNLVVQNKKLVSGPETIQLTQGDQVKITVTSDQAEELHLHGYDLSLELEPNKPAELSFTANLSGRFVYELEHSQTEIGSLEVLPK